MKIYAISDLHLCLSGEKPMDIFGTNWDNYLEKIKQDWLSKVQEEDVVLIAGDLSWAMKYKEAQNDLLYLNDLPGKKIVIRGNHDYWWGSLTKVRSILPTNTFALQNDAMVFGDYIFCGTRGWTVPENKFASEEDEKIYKRELIRLEMSLKHAKSLQKNNEKIIALIHYPPFNSKRNKNEFMALFEKYEVSAVIYGHLHGKGGRQTLVFTNENVKYYLTSCDLVNNNLVSIE